MTGETNVEVSVEPVVLIVNSDSAVRAALAALLETSGLRAIACESAAECLAQQSPRETACAILDVELPGASGFALQDALALDGTAVLFVTRGGSVASCSRALKAGAVDFLTLPCGSHEFLNAVHTAIEQGLASRTERERLGELRGRWNLLTEREREVFELIASGFLNKQAAEALGISEITVQIHRGRVMRKMGARSFAALVRMAGALQLPIAAISSTRPTAKCPHVRREQYTRSREIGTLSFDSAT